MIPYFELTSITIGAITIQVWGTLVALGILFGTWVSARFAKRNGLDPSHIYNGAFWLILSAFIGARIVHVLFYDLAFYLADPAEIVKIWNGGFSVIGGFIGAIVAYILYAKRHHFSALHYADSFIYGLPAGLMIGRIGCFLIHDHPGTATSFFLGVRNENGIDAFHDHGLYLAINGFVLALLFALFSKKKRAEAFYTQFFLIWYGAVRFVLDFFREVDATYLGVTPAQYVSFLMFFGGIIWLMTSRGKTTYHA